jgi:uncharacterized membrane protein
MVTGAAGDHRRMKDWQNMETTKPTYHRLWEVDTVRGIAIILMIGYHFVFDLAFFGAYSGNMYALSWQLFARRIGTTFILVMGISLTLRYNRLESEMDQKRLFAKYLRRGATVFGWGLVITVVTYLALDSGYVIFGILHLLGLSMLIAFPFLRSRWASLVAGIAAIGLGFYLNGVKVLNPWLLWLGVPQFGRHMVDYYPLLPWFGFALVGVYVGLTLYPQGARGFSLPDLSRIRLVRALGFLGRHSLLIYLIHQPIMLGILVVIGIGSI